MRERVRDGSIRYGNTWFVLSYGAELSDPSLSLDSEHPAGLQNRNGPAWSSEVSVKRPFICLDRLFSCRGVAARMRPKARVSVPFFSVRARTKTGMARLWSSEDGTGTVASDALFSSFSESCESAKCREMQGADVVCYNSYRESNPMSLF